MQLKPITINDNVDTLNLTENSQCITVLEQTLEFYNKVGFQPPWNSYFAFVDEDVIGICSFTGAPKNNRVEIAYFTFPEHEGKGFGTLMCTELVKIARATDPNVVITARTLPQMNASTAILRKNGFELQGVAMDHEEGEVWEWVLKN